MKAAIGFLVWCPEHGPPTMVHESFLAAVAEADRLKRLYPWRRFVVMAPVEDQSMIGYSLGWSRGHKEGLAQAHRAIVDAEAKADRLSDLNDALKVAQPLVNQGRRFQAIVADCLLWFEGFRAAHAPRDEWERPHTPSREDLRDLNAALQAIELHQRPTTLDEEIPF